MTDHKDCNCNHNDEIEIKVLFEGEDEEVTCDVLGIFPVEDKEYIAIVPQDNLDHVLIYGFEEEGDSLNLTEIESDEEYQRIAEEFDTLYFDEE